MKIDMEKLRAALNDPTPRDITFEDFGLDQPVGRLLTDSEYENLELERWDDFAELDMNSQFILLYEMIERTCLDWEIYEEFADYVAKPDADTLPDELKFLPNLINFIYSERDDIEVYDYPFVDIMNFARSMSALSHLDDLSDKAKLACIGFCLAGDFPNIAGLTHLLWSLSGYFDIPSTPFTKDDILPFVDTNRYLRSRRGDDYYLVFGSDFAPLGDDIENYSLLIPYDDRDDEETDLNYAAQKFAERLNDEMQEVGLFALKQYLDSQKDEQ